MSVVSSPGRVVKRVILGRAMRSDRLGETLLPKKLALPVFASDALSSVAYAPDEILLTLGLGGGALALTNSWKIALAVVVVMAVVIMSYRQNVHAYPSGGGDYEVASVNLGPKAGLTVASALLVDYVLTVAVSVSAGVQNAASAFEFLRGKEAIVAVLIVAALTAMNLRGVRESGAAFAVPTYLFMLSVIGMALFGFYRRASGDLPLAESGPMQLLPEPGYETIGGLALAFLMLRAFSSGCAALTGVEAISNGVPGLPEAEEQERRDDPAAHGLDRGDDAPLDDGPVPLDRGQDRRGARDPADPRRRAGRRHLRAGHRHGPGVEGGVLRLPPRRRRRVRSSPA